MHDIYYKHVTCDHLQYDLQIIHQHIEVGINLVNQIILGQIDQLDIPMIGNHQDEQMHEVQMIGEY
jgi:hypothetical protein